jgi:hypothetical protein
MQPVRIQRLRTSDEAILGLKSNKDQKKTKKRPKRGEKKTKKTGKKTKKTKNEPGKQGKSAFFVIFFGLWIREIKIIFTFICINRKIIYTFVAA